MPDNEGAVDPTAPAARTLESSHMSVAVRKPSAFPVDEFKASELAGKTLTAERAAPGNRACSFPTPLQTILWIAVMGFAALLYVSVNGSFQLGVYGDDASYVVLAESLLEADRYGLTNVPGLPSPTQFPFGFPLLLSFLLRGFPGNIEALTLLPLVATFVNGTLLFWGWRLISRRRSYWWALAVVGMYMLSPLTVDHTRMVMSEPVFTTFGLLAVGLASPRAAQKPGPFWAPALAASLVFAVATRTVGVILAAAVVLWLIAVYRRRFLKIGLPVSVAAALLLAFVLAATPVSLSDLVPSEYLNRLYSPFVGSQVMDAAPSGHEPAHVETGPARPSFATWLVDWMIIGGVKQHLGSDLREVAIHFGAGGWGQTYADRIGLPFLPLGMGFLVSLLVLFGLARLWLEEKVSAFALFGLLYTVLLFGWGWNGGRLLYPIQPQIHLGLILGLESVLAGAATVFLPFPRGHSFARIVLVGVVLFLFAIASGKSWRIDDSRIHAGDLEARTAWLSANSSPDDVFMSEAPEVDHLYSARRTVPFPRSARDAGDLRDYLAKYRVTYIILAPKIEWQTPRFVPRYGDFAAKFSQWLRTLEDEQLVRTVHSSDPELLRVYRVSTPAGQPLGSLQ